MVSAKSPVFDQLHWNWRLCRARQSSGENGSGDGRRIFVEREGELRWRVHRGRRDAVLPMTRRIVTTSASRTRLAKTSRVSIG